MEPSAYREGRKNFSNPYRGWQSQIWNTGESILIPYSVQLVILKAITTNSMAVRRSNNVNHACKFISWRSSPAILLLYIPVKLLHQMHTWLLHMAAGKKATVQAEAAKQQNLQLNEAGGMLHTRNWGCTPTTHTLITCLFIYNFQRFQMFTSLWLP